MVYGVYDAAACRLGVHDVDTERQRSRLIVQSEPGGDDRAGEYSAGRSDSTRTDGNDVANERDVVPNR